MINFFTFLLILVSMLRKVEQWLFHFSDNKPFISILHVFHICLINLEIKIEENHSIRLDTNNLLDILKTNLVL